MANRQNKKAEALAKECAKLEREGSEKYLQASLENMAPVNTKTLQLCRQVEQCLSISIPSIEEDEMDKLSVYGVQSMGGSANLMVLLLHQDADKADQAHCLEILEEYYSDLRDEVATAITRSRCPELSFRFVN